MCSHYMYIFYFCLAQAKFNIDGAYSIVLCDGCMVEDEDGFQTLPHNGEVFLLREGEDLNIPSCSSSSPGTSIFS